MAGQRVDTPTCGDKEEVVGVSDSFKGTASIFFSQHITGVTVPVSASHTLIDVSNEPLTTKAPSNCEELKKKKKKMYDLQNKSLVRF